MQFKNLNKVTASAPSADIQSVKQLSDNLFSMVSSLSVSEPSFEELAMAVSSATDHKVRVVEGSAKKVSEIGNLFHYLAVANTNTAPYSEASSMKVLAANIFEDSNSNIWRVVGEGDDRRIVMTSSDNLHEILSSKLSRKIVTTRTKLPTSVAAKTGDFCKFFNATAGAMDFGFAVEHEDGKFSVVTEKGEVEATRDSVVASIIGDTIEGMDDSYVEVAATQDGLKKIVEYLGSLFKGTQFYKDYIVLINKQLSLGKGE